jgi:hypothetical protein
MEDYLNVLNADPREWLLEPDNPSVRYFALTQLMGKSQAHPSVKKAKSDIMKVGPVPLILFKQEQAGYWGVAEDFYVRAKYKGTVWQMIVLASLGADGRDERLARASDFILDWSQDRDSGGFAYRGAPSGGQHQAVLPCLTGNMVWSLIRLGYLKDPRIQHAIGWMARFQRFDDGIERAPTGWPYDRFEQCWGRHTCHMGVVKTLKALAEIPAKDRSQDVRNSIERAVEYLLAHHVHKKSHDPSRVAKQTWLKFGFPLMWNTDALEMLAILVKLGYRDDRMREAVDLVVSKQDERGRWSLETTYNGRFQVAIERKNKPSKWVTLRALMVLKGFLGQDAGPGA